MSAKYFVSLDKVLKEFDFEVIYLPEDFKEHTICSPDVNRPGLLLVDRDAFFDAERAQFLGLSEIELIKKLPPEEQFASIERLMSYKPPFVLITRNLELPECAKELAQKYNVPLFRTAEPTSSCMSALISYLGTELAERITRHGVLVEVYGEGVLIVGDSGVGKSETAVELIKRGHRLIADDAVEIRKVSAKTLVGSAPDNIRHFIELRGIGIVNARRIFGMGAVKLSEKINMVVKLEQWNPDKVYDRMGVDTEYINIMNVNLPITVVPVKPGRNLAIIIEVAAMNNRQKKMGYNAAKELLHQLGMQEEEPKPEELEIWQSY